MPMIINNGQNFSGMTDGELLEAISKIPTSRCTKYQIMHSPCYNETINSAIIDTSKDDELILEIKGSGRILELLPLYWAGGASACTEFIGGTVAVLVDGCKYISKKIAYMSENSSYGGNPILSNIEQSDSNINSRTIGGTTYFSKGYTKPVGFYDSFCNDDSPIVMPNGIAFSEGLKVFMTTNSENIIGCKIYVVYELDM